MNASIEADGLSLIVIAQMYSSKWRVPYENQNELKGWSRESARRYEIKPALNS